MFPFVSTAGNSSDSAIELLKNMFFFLFYKNVNMISYEDDVCGETAHVNTPSELICWLSAIIQGVLLHSISILVTM